MIRSQKVDPLNFWSGLDQELIQVKDSSLYRSLNSAQVKKDGKVLIDGRLLLNFSSNNYLGLSEKLDAAVIGYKPDESFGATASRLIVGNHPAYTDLENQLTKLKGTESSLVFSCGYLANLGVISCLVGRSDAVFSDRLNHASITDAIVLSRAKHFRYRHNDAGHLNSLLKKNNHFRKKLIVTESLFSMDGDFAPLPEIVKLKEKFNAILMVDEAHSGGVYGKQGAGLVNKLGMSNYVEVQMGTFSKAYGCYGGYVCREKDLDRLLN